MKKHNKILEPNLLIPLLREGDMVAYETLFYIYYSKLLHIAKGYVGTHEDAEGIVQNIFLKIWDNKTVFDKMSSINNYLYTMTKNACLDFLKHKKIKNHFSKNYKEKQEAIQYQFIKDEAASLLLENELELRITKAIKKLPVKCKKVFLKSRLEGMKHSEIAKSLNISKRTVDNHISNALQHMRLHLKDFLIPLFAFFLNLI